jgi:hypothetical protein
VLPQIKNLLSSSSGSPHILHEPPVSTSGSSGSSTEFTLEITIALESLLGASSHFGDLLTSSLSQTTQFSCKLFGWLGDKTMSPLTGSIHVVLQFLQHQLPVEMDGLGGSIHEMWQDTMHLLHLRKLPPIASLPQWLQLL